MHPDLQAVIELQRVDSRIGELTSEIEAAPSRIKKIEAQLDDFIHAYEEHKLRLGANQKERRDLEGEIQLIRTKISKHRDQLYQVKTNEQYKAMLHEIEGEENNIRKIEDRVLEKMIEAEQLEKYVKDAAARLDGEKARVAAEKGRLESARQAATQEAAQLQEQRQRLGAALSENVHTLYEKLRKGRNGLAVAQVRDGSCTGCHVLLRPQAWNEVRANDHVMTCENCSRILYYVESPVDKTAEGTRVVM